MKFINRLLIVALVWGGISACDNLDMDLQTNPNAITPDKASLNDLYNNIQLTFRNMYNSAENNPGDASRMYMTVQFTYAELTTPTGFNALWNNAYSGLFPDIDNLIALSDATVAAGGNAFDIHVGTAKIMKAYTLMVLVDLMGDVPMTEAGQGTTVISPGLDDDAAVYAAAIAMLDEAIAQLTGTTAAEPAFDNFYGGDPDEWIKAANTMKLRAALNMGDAATINSLVAGGNIIDDESEDFQFNYGNQRDNPNSRHPKYNNHYETGDGDYLSNYYMWLLRDDKQDAGGNPVVDPRRRYYFYRKIDDAFNQDGTTYSCHFTALPDDPVGSFIDHYKAVDPNLPYCVVVDGYSGRDHMNGEGIPPDGPIRTSYGLYPFGGDFDADDFEDSRNSGTTGGLGQGILPILLSSFTDFMRAEAALTLGTGENAATLLESGIRKSMAKVRGFESLVPAKMSEQRDTRTGTGTVEELFAMTDADIDDYVNDVLALYNAAGADQLDVVSKEFLIAAWGNGLEAYNMYRRTGKPNNMQPAIEPTTGTASDPFPLTFLLPSQHVDRNSVVSQKSTTDRVFWNANGPTDLY